MKENFTKILTVCVLSVIGLTGLSAQISGMEVMENVYNRPVGEAMSAELLMTITNSRGSTRERSIVQYGLDAGDADKKIMFFAAPADVRDTSFMTWSWDDGRDDEQWIYLPALRRVKRISSDSKNDSFMGSDFTYDDLGDRHPSEDSHKIIGEESLKGEECYVIESTPVKKGDAFSKTVSWIIKDKWLGLQKEFHDKRGDVYKVLSIDKFEKIDGYWVVTDMLMEDSDRGSSTRIEMNDVSFSVSLEEDFFSERQMRLGPKR
ncbi:outer membrane lipoprotein-sorting protein [Marispirochaeta sp.]|jgi:outer membrane lipoprotein-sorting protein|uniref:outer membrane lipoprotein-sorting protein n=1 Tax=Marispirochaeta sp. TaxID=2038653 RepID=UPI0029C9A70F|nr:outer membrane lipoprotein-sorting protein [Marispirochaeta sp.]